MTRITEIIREIIREINNRIAWEDASDTVPWGLLTVSLLATIAAIWWVWRNSPPR